MFIVIEEEYSRKDTKKESRIETLQNRIPVFL